MTTARVGATKKYVQNWNRAFAGKKTVSAAKGTASAKGKAAKKK